MSICIDCGQSGADTRDGHAARCGPCRAAYGRFRASHYRLSRSLAQGLIRRCSVCGSREEPLTIDHVIPISRGGQSTRENTRLLCRPCNSRKGNRRQPPPTPKKSGT